MNRKVLPFVTTNMIRMVTGLAVMFLIASCGSNRTADTRSDTAPATGSVAFTVEWEPPPASPNASPAKGFFLQPMAPAIDVCTDYGIETVTMKVLSGDNVLASAGYPCTQHSGTLNNIPAGNNLVLRLEASVPGVGTVWAGDTAFNLSADETKNVGKVTMAYTGTDKTAPSVLSVSPDNNATHVLNNSTIRVVFSERMAINTVQDNGAIVVTDNVSGPVPGMITYNSSDSSATFKPDSPFAGGARVSVSVTNTAMDIATNRLSPPKTWSFLAHVPGTFVDPFLLENDDRGNAQTPQIAVDKNGNAIVVWSQSDGTINYIYYNRYSASSNSWTGATLLEVNPANAFDPQVVMDGDGNALVVWGHSNTPTNFYSGIWTKSYSAATQTWAGQSQIQHGGAVSPKIAIEQDSRSLVAWQVDNTINFIWSSSFPGSGNKFFVASDNTASSHQVAMDRNGNALVVWKQSDGIRYNILVNRFSASNQTWSSPALIESDDTGDADSPQLAMDGNGNAVVVWEQSPPYPNPTNLRRVWSNRYSAATQTWAGATLLFESTNSVFEISPTVAIDETGNAIIVWNSNFSMYYSRYAASTQTWSDAVIFDNVTGGGLFPTTKVAMDGSGNAVAVWKNLGSGNIFSLYSSRYSAATQTWSVPALVEFKNRPDGVDISLDVSANQVAMDGNGNAIAVWVQRNENLKYDIWANRTY